MSCAKDTEVAEVIAKAKAIETNFFILQSQSQ